MDYTDEQLKILSHDPTKHACILAGPGTGKSSIIIDYIIKTLKENPSKKIRLLTFTRAANRELVFKIREAKSKKIDSSTIHSFAISILLFNPGISSLPEPLRIADDWEWDELIRKYLSKEIGVNVRVIDKLKNEMSAHWESLFPELNNEITKELRAKFMGYWEEHRRIYGYTLLAEIPFRLKESLESNPEIDLSNLELIAVDEYQDLNSCDLKCIKLISEYGKTIIGIGDDDQSIYKFRKAHPEGIRNFLNEYKAIDYPLTISHRCGTKILNWANYVIQGDTSRKHERSLKPGEKCPEGIVNHLVFSDQEKEALGASKIVKWLEEQNVPLEEILILVRTNVIANLVKRVFREQSIFYADYSEAKELLNDKKTRILLSILHLLINNRDSLSWWTILSLTKGIGNKTIESIFELAKEDNILFSDTIQEEHGNDFKDIKKNRTKLINCVSEIINKVINIEIPEDNVRWGNWIIDKINGGKLPDIPEGMKDLFLQIDNFKDDIEQISLDQYINQIEPTIKDIMNSKINDRIRIMTISGSKGLTSRAAIIMGAEEGIIPLPKGDRQEERRLLYVGMTRAKEFLYITRCLTRIGPTARSGETNVAGFRNQCPFLSGGPISQSSGEKFLERISQE